jgi:hypothetical protein
MAEPGSATGVAAQLSPPAGGTPGEPGEPRVLLARQNKHPVLVLAPAEGFRRARACALWARRWASTGRN